MSKEIINPLVNQDMAAVARKNYNERIKDVSFNIANGAKERFNSISLHDFKHFFWPWLSGKVEETVELSGVTYNYKQIWLDRVAGSPFLAVNILDDEKNIITTVPALADSGVLDGTNLRHSGNSKIEAASVGLLINQNSNISDKGSAMLSALTNRYDKVLKNASSGYIDKWEELFNYFGESIRGKTPEEINANNIKLGNKAEEVVSVVLAKTETKSDAGFDW